MEKVHSDNVKDIIDANAFKPTEEVTFKMGEADLIGFSQKLIDKVNTIEPGKDIKLVCIAPAKFEVWA